MAPPSSKEIKLIIEGENLAGKPLADLDKAVQSLAHNVEALAPASAKGEAKLDELKAVATELKAALSGLLTNTKIIELFQKLSTEFAESSTKLKEYQQRLDAAKQAMAGVEKPTKEMSKAVKDAGAAFASQEKTVLRQAAALQKLQAQAAEAKIDLGNVAGAQEQISKTLAVAVPAYDKVNAAISAFAGNQRRVAQEAQAAATAQRQAADQASATAKLETEAAAKRARALEGLLAAQQRSAKEASRIAAAQAASAAQSRREVEAVEKTRNALTAKVVAEREAAQAALALAAAADKEAAAEERATRAARDWAEMEKRAAAALGSTATTVRATAGATAAAADAQGRLTSSFKLFRDEGRTTLSLYQRLRGEILGLTSSFIGFYAAIQQVTKILEANQKQTQAQNTFAVAFGAEGVADQMKFVAAEADRLGFALDKLQVSYGKFAVAAVKTGASVQTTQFIFSKFSEVSRVMNLTGEQTELIFKALEQIFSKGKVQSEELKGQLGDVLPAAVATFAKAMDKPVAKFQKLLELGNVSSDNLLLFAQELGEQYGEQLPKALDSTQAKIGRFQTEVFKLRNAIFEGEFGKAFGGALDELTKFFKGNEGKQFAEDLSTALAAVAKAFVLILRHLDSLKLILEVIAVRWVVTFGASAATNIINLSTQIVKLGLAINAASAASTDLKGALGKASIASAALIGGLQLGTWLNDQFLAVRLFGVRFVQVFVVGFAAIKKDFDVWLAGIMHPFTSGKLIDAINKEFVEKLKKLNAKFDDQAAALREESTGGSGSAGTASSGGKTPEQIARENAEEAARIRRENEKRELEAIEKAAGALQDRLSQLRGQVLRKDATNVEEFVASLRESYAPIFKDIDQLKKDFGEGATKQVVSLRRQLNAIITAQAEQAKDKFNLDRVKKDEQEINDLITERNAAIEVQNALKRAGAQSDEKTKTAIAEIGNSFNAEIATKVKALQDFIASIPPDVHGKIKREADRLQLILATLVERPLHDPLLETKNATEDIAQQLRLRDKLIEGIKAQAKVEGEAASVTLEKVKATRAEFEQYVDKAKELIVWIETTNELTEDQRKALGGVKADLQIIVASQKEIAERAFSIRDASLLLANSVVAFADGFAKAAVNTKSLWGAIKGAWAAFKGFAADFLLQIARMIIQAQILKLLQSTTWGSNLVSGISSGLSSALHSGGIAGQARPKTHRVPDWVWLNAARYHGGGMPGIRRNEVPAILQKGEEVLTRDDPRHRFNKGGGERSISIFNGIDPEEMVRQGLAAPSNHKVIINLMRSKKSSFKRALE